jgi:hypothetical protein
MFFIVKLVKNRLAFLFFIATAKWFCNCSVSLRPADCVVKPRRCAASPVFYALSTELMKTDHFTKPLRGDYNCTDKIASQSQQYYPQYERITFKLPNWYLIYFPAQKYYPDSYLQLYYSQFYLKPHLFYDNQNLADIHHSNTKY